MVSRTVPILLIYPNLEQTILNCLVNFLTAYFTNQQHSSEVSGNLTLPNLPNYLVSVFIALDLISILDSYSTIDPGLLQFYPFLSRVFFNAPNRSLTSLLNAIYEILDLNLDDNSNSFGRLPITNK